MGRYNRNVSVETPKHFLQGKTPPPEFKEWTEREYRDWLVGHLGEKMVAKLRTIRSRKAFLEFVDEQQLNLSI